MKYIEIITKNVILNLEKKDLFNKYKLKDVYFTRNRKVTIKDIILYLINKRGLSNKMEILNFNDTNYVKNISAPGFYKQRKKLSFEIFNYLIEEGLKPFYNQCSNEAKKFKNYILLGIDGSDFEIPNSPITRKRYNGKLQEQCARITVSTCYDLLNEYTLDTIIKPYNSSETKMAEEHRVKIKESALLGDLSSILIMDRGYNNLSNIYNYVKSDQKFILRISSSVYEKENQQTKTNDEIIKIGYEYNRVKYYKDKDEELYNYLKEGNTIDVRCTKIELSTGEIEYLISNLPFDEFSYEDLNELYNARWGIELNYKHLKNNLKIESISSTDDNLIKQDILSQIYVANILQAFINDIDDNIEQSKFKNKMKTNKNMAIGIYKSTYIYILLENDPKKRSELILKLLDTMKKFIIPVKKNRINPRKNNITNRYNINQRKTF